MREGMVFEVYRDYVIVMTDGGEFLKLRKKGNPAVGDIYIGKPYIKFPACYAAAAAILIFLTSFAGINAYAHQIVGVVDIAGNKDVHLYINRMGNVQKVEGLSSTTELKNVPVEKAIKKIEDELSDSTALSSKPLSISLKELKPSKVDLKKIEKSIENTIAKNKVDNSTVKPSNQGEKSKPNDNKDSKPKGYEKKDEKKVNIPNKPHEENKPNDDDLKTKIHENKYTPGDSKKKTKENYKKNDDKKNHKDDRQDGNSN